MLSKEQIVKLVSKLPFPVMVLHPIEFMMRMGPNALYVEACYSQMVHHVSGQYFEGILFNSAHSQGGIDSPWFQHVLFHELAHATGNHERLARIATDLRMQKHIEIQRFRIIEELIAERTAQKAMEYFGIYTDEIAMKSRAYINHYLNELDGRDDSLTEIEAYRVERDATRALDFILRTWCNESNAAQKAAA
jgi:hypothetical protein